MITFMRNNLFKNIQEIITPMEAGNSITVIGWVMISKKEKKKEKRFNTYYTISSWLKAL